ncbi:MULTISPECIES: glycosyltransferase family 2 protein [Paenibacillus]|uniref:Glycosyltransferase n=1 Tax=Paenibacillus radicis (ex Xue et al. 2023) TaxID=2972489 RepID=A0ABT1YA86_9BACL|nr:glycosyltransferase family 2 protein [Paenibacillus radicis (ex Xue et al. 2023)]MCR8629690.1 glycosyltransferase [Paenibacillus radicis (ex Xue et al. 2023)]
MRPTRKNHSAGMRAIRSKVSVIIPIMNESRTLRAVIREVKKLQPNIEIILVVNGSTDGSAAIARASGARVIFFDQPLGHDVGRSVGARYASGDILLFLDGDMVLSAAQLLPFLRAVERGADIALNRYNGPVNKHNVHPVVLAKHALNVALRRADLRGASMTTIPHAMSRRALAAIGAENLAVPPKAQTIAIQQRLRVEAVHLVQVGLKNPIRRTGRKGGDPLGRLIVGDHLEAICWYTQATNERGWYSDLLRNRSMVR